MKKLLLGAGLALSLTLFAQHSLAAQLCPGGTDGECTDVGGVTYECDTSQTPFTCVAAGAGTGQGSVGSGGACSNDGQCAGNLACINKVCQIDPSLEDPGTAGAGGACDPANNGSDCPGGQTCNAATKTCVGGTGAPSSTSNGSFGFTPLAPIPGLTQGGVADSAGIANFLNNLYKYLIGIAAILAVIQIIRGGLEYATQDSVSKHADGKHHIEQAILGLVLVLSPVLVFSLINPSILKLSLNLPKLNTAPGNATAGGPNDNNGSGSAATVNTGVAGCVAQKGATTGVTTFTCSDTTSDTTNTKAQDYLAQSCKGDSNKGSITANATCSTSAAGMSGGVNTSTCTQWSASGYCSPVQTVQIAFTCKVDITNPTGPTDCTAQAYYGAAATWAGACPGGGYQLYGIGSPDFQLSGESMSSVSLGGNNADVCPSQYANYKCAKFQAYCGLTN
jgi:hypothetical protein